MGFYPHKMGVLLWSQVRDPELWAWSLEPDKAGHSSHIYWISSVCQELHVPPGDYYGR